ncbi:helicase [Scytonema hofmannii PCC 7110]|uniref:Helicase n=1 Tax=Scytonema hofmannii PCC 7110 TaxID=128403 RepID=A0A139WQ92_9CYAN|nr:competence protein CoiA family protein [Scytonema hofmannii]KYC34599.1 helicase [Scytonema hofmannii PCC 7110]
MWLNYGVNQDGALVFIDDVPKGKTQLHCPYCSGRLTAKKGTRKEHHFAHTEDTCREVSRSTDIPTLPLFDKFHLELTGKELEQLEKFWRKGHCSMVRTLESQKLLQWNEYKGRVGRYELTKLGKIPLGQLSLQLFNEIQEPLIEKKLRDLQRSVLDAYDTDSPLLVEKLTDLKIYRAQLQRILANTLYFLLIQASGETFYKIGVTRRPVQERFTEIQNQLCSQFQQVTIKTLGTWEHRGNVELYFKHRYRDFNYMHGTSTEYYKFDDATSVLLDLRRMKPKVLTEVETGILNGFPDQVEVGIQADQKATQRSQAIKTGMSRAKLWGTHVGRPTETDEGFLQKPSSQKVISALYEGLSLRKAAERAGVAVNTVRKVQALLHNKSTT